MDRRKGRGVRSQRARGGTRRGGASLRSTKSTQPHASERSATGSDSRDVSGSAVDDASQELRALEVIRKHREEAAANITRLLSESGEGEQEASNEAESALDERARTASTLQSTFNQYEETLRAFDGKASTDLSAGTPSALAIDRTRNRIQQSLQQSWVCVVCLENVKRRDAVWQCTHCYVLLHLPCIASWVRNRKQMYQLSADNFDKSNEELLPFLWPCPNCRAEHIESEAPHEYVCFCGKVRNPPADAWLSPHTCGKVCGKRLAPDCGHTCTLLCHPGPCPPCPQVIAEASCYCGKKRSARRCAQREYDCGAVCGRELSCGYHTCPRPCHPGECGPCGEMRLQRCKCGAEEREHNCGVPLTCDRVCGKPLSCGNHTCELLCHTGNCGGCPREGPRSCFCGERQFTDMLCTDKDRSCGGTCGKILECGNHRCTDRCHAGPCSTCKEMVNKRCECGLSKQLMQCHMTYRCKSKCGRTRNCGRHKCRQRCCRGRCPPCEEVCNRPLNCGNHRCEMTCHDGPCFPCPVTVDIACFCGHEVISVVCAFANTTEPPQCHEPCSIPPVCHHPAREPHACHFGVCPPCTRVCGVLNERCNHTCPRPCHDPDKQPFIPKKQRRNKYYRPEPPKPTLLEDVQCGPCEIPVQRSCRGRHETRTVACKTPFEFSCGKRCGQMLDCTNHRCTLECHDLPPEGEKVNSRCRQCTKRCQKPRDPPCKHPCPLPCHPGPCPPCEVIVGRRCHCLSELLIHMKCCETHDEEQLNALRSCKQLCKKLLNPGRCPHRCERVCHPGPCFEGRCDRPVVAYCACKRLSREVACWVNQGGEAIVCDEECERLKKERRELEEAEQERLRELKREEELRRAEESEQQAISGARKRKQRRKRSNVSVQTDASPSRWQEAKNWVHARRKGIVLWAIILASLMLLYVIFLAAHTSKRR